jgi:hypothetical protein
MMLPSFFRICCRQLVQALRGAEGPEGETTFFLGFDDEGRLFYKVGNTLAGQTMSVCTEPLVFCPFCGRRVSDGEVAEAESVSTRWDEEATVLSLEVTREIETILAQGGGLAHSMDAAAAATHVTDF